MARIPYLLNILILAPVVYRLLFGSNGMADIFGPGLSDSETLRPLVASLWLGVLVCSGIALMMPERFWPLLVFQVVYKAAFLGLHVAPTMMSKGAAAAPAGVSITFLFIVVVWPWFIRDIISRP
jgi:hypothetical protein